MPTNLIKALIIKRHAIFGLFEHLKLYFAFE